MFRYYEIYRTLEAAIKLQNFPNLHAVANKLVGRSTELVNKYIQYGKARIQPGLQYFQAKFSNELSVSLSPFKAACLFVPAKLKELKPDITIVYNICFYRLYDGFTGAVHHHRHYLN